MSILAGLPLRRHTASPCGLHGHPRPCAVVHIAATTATNTATAAAAAAAPRLASPRRFCMPHRLCMSHRFRVPHRRFVPHRLCVRPGPRQRRSVDPLVRARQVPGPKTLWVYRSSFDHLFSHAPNRRVRGIYSSARPQASICARAHAPNSADGDIALGKHAWCRRGPLRFGAKRTSVSGYMQQQRGRLARLAGHGCVCRSSFDHMFSCFRMPQ